MGALPPELFASEKLPDSPHPHHSILPYFSALQSQFKCGLLITMLCPPWPFCLSPLRPLAPVPPLQYLKEQIEQFDYTLVRLGAGKDVHFNATDAECIFSPAADNNGEAWHAGLALARCDRLCGLLCLHNTLCCCSISRTRASTLMQRTTMVRHGMPSVARSVVDPF